jgi:alcohol dehydrogenase (NADP+)
VIPGHEIIGSVSAVGSDVTHLKVGDRVGIGAQCGSCLNKNKDCTECEQGWEQHCRNDNHIWTYNSAYPDGQISQGGYADRVRCAGQFAFKIPEVISSAEAAPLMCAGVTVFAPLQRYMTRPHMKVAIIGIGGLGHLAVMYAAKLLGGSAEVTAVSHNSKKKDEALKMGAKYFLDTSDKAALKAAFRTFDFVLSTANGSKMDLGNWLSTVKLAGTFCTVGLPEEPLQVHAFSLMGAQINLTASGIGSRKEIEQMLEFSAKHNVRPIIEKLPMEKANDGIKKVRDGSVRFRVVLENPNK